MPYYQFVIHEGSNRDEILGVPPLEDDVAAVIFGAQMIQELLHENPIQYLGWTMDITEEGRIVGGVPFTQGALLAASSGHSCPTV